MQEPKHTIKRRLKRFDDSYFWTKPCEHYGWLGSGVKDINDREIFEGDIVQFGVRKGAILWLDGELAFKEPRKPYDCFGNYFSDGQCVFEIVGHITDEDEATVSDYLAWWPKETDAENEQ